MRFGLSTAVASVQRSKRYAHEPFSLPHNITELNQGVRERLGIAPHDHLLLLVGQDGKIKRKGPLATDLYAIIGQIDTMPMRREEMRDPT